MDTNRELEKARQKFPLYSSKINNLDDAFKSAIAYNDYAFAEKILRLQMASNT